jgi:hypothetical protein
MEVANIHVMKEIEDDYLECARNAAQQNMRKLIISLRAPSASLVRLNAEPIIVHLLVDANVLDEAAVLLLEARHPLVAVARTSLDGEQRDFLQNRLGRRRYRWK